MRWTCYLTKNREKTYRWLQATYQKCTAKFLWTSFPSFSKSTQREYSIITVERDIRRSTQNLLPLSNHCFSQTSELDKRRCILLEVTQRAHSNIIVIYSNVALIKTLGSMFLSWIFKYSLLMVTVPRYPKWRGLMDGGPFVAVIQQKRGWLGFKLFCFLTAYSQLNPS